MPDRSSFTEYIEKNMTLYALRNELTLSMSASASFIRNQLASALRRAPFQVLLLLFLLLYDYLKEICVPCCPPPPSLFPFVLHSSADSPLHR